MKRDKTQVISNLKSKRKREIIDVDHIINNSNDWPISNIHTTNDKK